MRTKGRIKADTRLLVALGVLATLFAGCGSDGSKNPVSSGNVEPGSIIGRWNLTAIRSVWDGGSYNVPAQEIAEDPLIYEFRDDGTGTQTYQGSSLPFSWVIQGSTLNTMDQHGNENTYGFSATSATLKLTFTVVDGNDVYTVTHTFSRL